MDQTSNKITSGAGHSRSGKPSERRRIPRIPRPDWPALVGTLPFLVFAAVMIIMPTVALLANAFVDRQGRITLANFADLATSEIANAFLTSIEISAATAVLGALLGLSLALIVGRGIGNRKARTIIMTFCGVASNFSGVPLAFAFIATFGRLGLVTVVLRQVFGINLYASGFDLASFSGLVLTYLFFQVPIALTIMMPAVDRLPRECREAAEMLGATACQYWLYIGLPVLWPTLLGTLALLFANAFGAIATAYALTGYAVNIVPILLYAQIRGDVLHNEQLGAALALCMVLVVALAITAYLVLRARAERWMR